MKAYQLKVVIEESDPPIWRRVIVPAEITFGELHDIIDELFSWAGYHMYKFRIPSSNTDIMEVDDSTNDHKVLRTTPLLDADEVFLDEYLEEEQEIEYIYDFGDNWCHMITLEKVLDNYTKNYPKVLGYGEDNPMEDSGGLHGYYEKRKILNDPTHPEHGEIAEWAKSIFYESFDQDEVNEVLRSFYTETDEEETPKYYDTKESITLIDLLRYMDEDDLYDIADDFGYEEEEIADVDKDELLIALSRLMLDPDVFYDNFVVLRDEEIEAFELAAKEGITYYEGEDEETVENLISLVEKGYIGLRDDDGLDIPTDVYARYKEVCSEEFHKQRHRISWLLDCLDVVKEIYGMAPLSVVCDLYNTKEEFHITEEMLTSLVETLPQDNQEFILRDQMLVSEELLVKYEVDENGEETSLYRILSEIQGDVPYYMPTLEEIEGFASMGAFPQEELADLVEYLDKAKDIDVEDVIYLSITIQHMFRQGAEFGEVFELLHSLEIEFTESELEQLIAHMQSVWESTRMLLGRGNTPVDIENFEDSGLPLQ